MKNLILIALIMLLLAGCNKSADVVKPAQTKSFLMIEGVDADGKTATSNVITVN